MGIIEIPKSALLQAKVELAKRNESNVRASKTGGPGSAVVLQTVKTGGELAGQSHPPRKAEEYIVTVSGANGTTGGYRTQIILNAAIEKESHDGPQNDSLSDAQRINSSFLRLRPSLTTVPRRGAVLGNTWVW